MNTSEAAQYIHDWMSKRNTTHEQIAFIANCLNKAFEAGRKSQRSSTSLVTDEQAKKMIIRFGPCPFDVGEDALYDAYITSDWGHRC